MIEYQPVGAQNMTTDRNIKTSVASLQIIADHLRRITHTEASVSEIDDAVLALESVVAELLVIEHPTY